MKKTAWKTIKFKIPRKSEIIITEAIKKAKKKTGSKSDGYMLTLIMADYLGGR